MKTLYAALASAALLAAPLAASAQDHHGGWGGYSRGQAGAVNPAPANPAPAGPAPQGQAGGWGGSRQGGGFGQRGGGAVQAQPQQQWQGQRSYGGGERRGFAGGGAPQQNFDHRGGDRRDYGRGGYEGRGFEGRGFTGRDYRQNYAYRGYDRGYNRAFRWGVGAFLPRTYWHAYIDPYAYGLGVAPYGYHWVVVGDEALLIDDYTGAIVQEQFL